MKNSKKRIIPKHWYKITYTECVLCSSSGVTRERIYGEKPKDYKPEFEQYACGYHFA